MPHLSANRKHGVSFMLNGKPVSTEVAPRMLLSDVLRHELGLTGTHVGCEHGVCGACTVQIDSEPARACLTLAVQVEGADVRTVEALAPQPGVLSPLQSSFREHYGLQCGFCTTGILMSLDALLSRNPAAGVEEIRAWLCGHLCRCTGYATIVESALAVTRKAREGQEDDV